MAADPKGGAAAGQEVRERHERGAVPAAAAAASQHTDGRTNTKWVEGKRQEETLHNSSG